MTDAISIRFLTDDGLAAFRRGAYRRFVARRSTEDDRDQARKRFDDATDEMKRRVRGVKLGRLPS